MERVDNGRDRVEIEGFSVVLAMSEDWWNRCLSSSPDHTLVSTDMSWWSW